MPQSNFEILLIIEIVLLTALLIVHSLDLLVDLGIFAATTTR